MTPDIFQTWVDLLSQCRLFHPAYQTLTLRAWLLKPRSWGTGTSLAQSFSQYSKAEKTFPQRSTTVPGNPFLPGVNPIDYSVSQTLAFLQSGLDQHLALCTLKGQVSPLSSLFQKSLSSFSLVKNIIQDVSWIRPPLQPPVLHWDLNLVLSLL